MNLGRFHSAITELRYAIELEKTIAFLSALQTALQQSISQQTPEAAQSFKNQYANLIKALESSRTNKAFPTRRMIFEEIGALKLVGKGLMSRIETILNENQITPANAFLEVQKITIEVTEFFKTIKTIEDAFDKLNIEYDDLSSGEFEVGFSFPRKVVGNTLESLESEFGQIDYAIRTFQEIAGETGGSPTIKTISASEWQIFLDSMPATAACVATAIERIVALYKNNLEIRLLKKQLEEKNLPEEVTKPLQIHIESTVKIEIKNIATQLVDEIYQGEAGRKNELKNKAPKALRYIADWIDKGATIEFHAEPPTQPKLEEEGGEEDGDTAIEKQKQIQAYEKLKKLTDSINDRMVFISEIKRADEPTLFLNYDKNEDGSE